MLYEIIYIHNFVFVLHFESNFGFVKADAPRMVYDDIFIKHINPLFLESDILQTTYILITTYLHYTQHTDRKTSK